MTQICATTFLERALTNTIRCERVAYTFCTRGCNRKINKLKLVLNGFNKVFYSFGVYSFNPCLFQSKKEILTKTYRCDLSGLDPLFTGFGREI